MNPPLPKPTQPAKTDDSQQTVVFDQKIPLAQKQSGVSTAAPTSSSTPDSTKPATPSTVSPTAPAPTAPTPATQAAPLSPPPTTLKQSLPPSSLSALSSMSSNKIPDAQTAPAVTPATPMPQRTVLGQPIPQAIRGEATPPGMGKPAPQMQTPPTPMIPTPGSPIPTSSQVAKPGVSVPTTPSPTSAQSATDAKNPSVTPTTQKPGSDPKKADPTFAKTKSPILKFLPFLVGGIVLLIILIFGLSRFLGGGSTSVSNNTGSTPTNTAQTGSQRTEVPAQKTTIEYWGLWEPTEVMQEVINDFQSENPGIEVKYIQQSPISYRERLQTALQNGAGPDLFRFHASWVPMLKTNLDPIPASVATASDLKDNYYPVVSEQLVSSGQYVGLPLMYDGLVLYYNEAILTTAGETPPKTWPELRALAVKLTVPSANGIERGGLAIGNATNVEHFSDILATLILQNGGNLADADSVETRDALLFYTNFQTKDKVWNETLPNSTVAFAREDVAMMFAPSWRAHEIKALNPELKFSTAALPQLSEDEEIAWATYWAEGISATSKKKAEAGKFLAYLSRDDVLQKFYSEASKVRAFGEIYPKVDMADELTETDVVAPVLEDAVIAQSGYLNSFTHDNGINDQMISYYKTAIDSLLTSSNIEQVQAALSTGVAQVLKQYGVSTK